MTAASPRVLVLGGINMGLITRAGTLPAPGQTLRGERFYSSPGGKGATQAVAAARQDARVKMVGRVGDDLFGPALLESLRSHGVDTSDVAVDAQAASGVGVILVDGSGQNRVLATYGANLRCGEEQLRAVEAALPDTDVLLLQMEIPLEVSLRAAQAAGDRNVRVMLDPAPAADIPADAFAAFDIIAPNQTEAEFLVGVAVDGVETAARAAGLLLERGSPAAVIKMAELGAYYRSGDEEGSSLRGRSGRHHLRGRRLPGRPRRLPGRGQEPARRRHVRRRGRGPGSHPAGSAGLDARSRRGRGAARPGVVPTSTVLPPGPA